MARRTGPALGLLVILLVAGVLRGAHVREQSVFIDEDLYTVAVLRLDSFSPRSIGRMAAQVVKPPLPLVSQAVLGRLTGDALTAGRLLSGFGGLVTTLLTFALGWRLSGGQASAALVAAAAYALSPVAVLHERLALHDGLLTAATLGSVLVGWSAIERCDVRRGVWAACLGGLAVQMKLPGVALALAPGLLLIACPPLTRRRARLAAVIAAGPLVSYLGLRASPLGPFLAFQDDARLAPLSALDANWTALRDAAQAYVPAVLGLLAVLGLVRLARDAVAGLAVMVAVIGMLALWIVPWVLISNFAPSRYDLPAVPYVAALAGVGAAWLLTRARQRSSPALTTASVLLIGVGLGSSGVLAAAVAFDRAAAQLSALDDWQYRTGWPAGVEYGRAAARVATMADLDGRVYMINEQHSLAAGAYDRQSSRFWIVEPHAPFPPEATGELVVVIDDVRLEPTGELVGQSPSEHLDQLRQAAPGARVVDFVPGPESNVGVAVLRVRLPARGESAG